MIGDNVELPVLNTDVVDRHDSRVSKLGEPPRFLQDLFILDLARVSSGTHCFDGHRPVELSIVAKIDGAETADPQGAPNLITAEGCWWC